MNEESRKFFETVRDYLLIYMAKQRGMSRHTIDSYKQTINQYLSFLVENKSIKYENIRFSDWPAANTNEYLPEIDYRGYHLTLLALETETEADKDIPVADSPDLREAKK